MDAIPKDGLGKPDEVADVMQIPSKTLAQWRHRGIGPDYVKVGKHVRYPWVSVGAWLASHTITPGAQR